MIGPAESLPIHEQDVLQPSPAVAKYALEAAQCYLLNQHEEGTIYEVGGPPSADAFAYEFRKLWEYRARINDPAQIDADLAEIQRMIVTEGPEALIEREQAARAAARSQRPETEPLTQSPEDIITPGQKLGKNILRQLFRR